MSYIVKLDTQKQSFSKEVLTKQQAETLAKEIWTTFNLFGETFTVSIFRCVGNVDPWYGVISYNLED